MSAYVFQAEATREFGIEFRSKLEAQWAYEFARQGWNWEYTDASWHDFSVNEVFIEIKPDHPALINQAIARVPGGSCWMLIAGDPQEFVIYDASGLGFHPEFLCSGGNEPESWIDVMNKYHVTAAEVLSHIENEPHNPEYLQDLVSMARTRLGILPMS